MPVLRGEHERQLVDCDMSGETKSGGKEHKHEIVLAGMVNVNRDNYLQGVVDVWVCRGCKKLFCDDKRYGEPLKPSVGFEEVPEDEQWGKPHPAVFLTAAAKLGAPPRRCLVWEDAPAGVLAAKAADLDLMRLFLEHGADPNIPTQFHHTALMVAAASNNLAGVKILAEKGANLNYRSGADSKTALGIAKSGIVNQDLVDYLTNAGAQE